MKTIGLDCYFFTMINPWRNKIMFKRKTNFYQCQKRNLQKYKLHFKTGLQVTQIQSLSSITTWPVSVRDILHHPWEEDQLGMSKVDEQTLQGIMGKVLLVHLVHLAHREHLLGGKEADIPFTTSYSRRSRRRRKLVQRFHFTQHKKLPKILYKFFSHRLPWFII